MAKFDSLIHSCLAQLEWKPEASSSTIAKALGTKLHVISHQRRKLQQAGHIQMRPFIDIHQLGFIDVGVFLNFSAKRTQARASIVKKLSALSSMCWFGECIGRFQYGMSFLFDSSAKLFQMLDDTDEITGGAEKELLIRRSFTKFPRGYLRGIQVKRNDPYFSVSKELPPILLDSTDRKILSVLANETYSSFRELAVAYNIPPATFVRRVSALEKKGVIKGYYLEIAPHLLNRRSIKLLIKTVGKRPQARKAIYTFLSDQPDVTYVLENLGRWDFEIGVEPVDESALFDFISELVGSTSDYVVSAEPLEEVNERVFSLFPRTFSSSFS